MNSGAVLMNFFILLTIRPLDFFIVLLYFVAMMIIGWLCSKKNQDMDGYFLARGRMPGWVTGFSLMATLISSMTFIATPGFSFKENWRYMPANFSFIIAVCMAIYIFMPIFRGSNIPSAYEYLERRFGAWARYYAAAGYIVMQTVRLGLVTYTVSLTLQIITGCPLELIIILTGVVVVVYTVAGGLEAVIWTDMIQGIGLILGGLICLPVIVFALPGGFNQIITTAYADGKMSLGSMDFTFTKITFWVMIIPAIFNQLWCVEQSTVQRYIAPKTDREAKKALWFGVLATIPIWIYFTFLGTAMYVFYKAFPEQTVNDMVPEQVLPYFILTKVPMGLAGIVIIGIVAAAQSTLSSSLNSAANIFTNDFYKRLIKLDKSESHYLKASKICSLVFGVLMITLAFVIYYIRSSTIQDLNTVLYHILSSGIFGLFVAGVLTRSVDGKSAGIATILTVIGVLLWLFFDTDYGRNSFPAIVTILPNKFWISTFANMFLFLIALLLSKINVTQNKICNIDNLTIFTTKTNRKD
jgi:solute:Na+ symporter, SSS family